MLSVVSTLGGASRQHSGGTLLALCRSVPLLHFSSGIILYFYSHLDFCVPKIHPSNVKLDHPEKKFRAGQAVTAGVLTSNPARRPSISITVQDSIVMLVTVY
jgi:hypothetical protein